MNHEEARRFAVERWKDGTRTLMDDPIMRCSPIQAAGIRITRLDDTGRPTSPPIANGVVTLATKPMLGGPSECHPIGRWNLNRAKVTITLDQGSITTMAQVWQERVVTMVAYVEAMGMIAEAFGLSAREASVAFGYLAEAYQKSLVKGMGHAMEPGDQEDSPRRPERACPVCSGRTVRRPRWSPTGRTLEEGAPEWLWDLRCARCARMGCWPEVLDIDERILGARPHVTVEDEINLVTMTGEGDYQTPEDQHMADCEQE